MEPSAAGREDGSRRILLIEDDHDICASMQSILSEEGFRVDTCRDGQEALSRLAGKALPDLIILDLMMPVMDGWQFRIHQKNDPALAHIPVIAISADVSPKAAAVDAAAYLTKPFEHASLMRTIERVLLAFERRQLHVQLSDIDAQSRSLDAMKRFKSAFISNVSHEIRTPLNAVLSLSQLMRNGAAGPLTEEQIRYLEIIQRSGQSVLNLVSDIIDLANLESGDLEVRSEEIDLASVVQSVLPALLPFANTKRLGLRVEVPETLPRVRADGHRAGQVVGHLAGNAIKFTERGSIKILAEAQPGFVAVHVSDTGIGIPEDAMARIFEGFFQIDRRAGRRHQGAGIGLTLVDRLVHLMGGQLSVRSTVGSGSRFTFTLPLAAPAHACAL
jgi:signal transduction histidine kinase